MVAGSAPAAVKAAGNTIKSDIYDISKKSPKIYYEDITNIPKIFPNFKNLLSNYFLFVKSGSILYTVYRSIGYSFIYPAIFLPSRRGVSNKPNRHYERLPKNP